MAQFRPADHSKGDANTIGGYMAVHDRPAAFEGTDGFSYSVEILADETGEPARPFGGFLLFVRWARVGAQNPEGHLETGFLAWGDTEDDARAAVGALPLQAAREALDTLIAERSPGGSTRRWFDVMRDPSDEGDA